MAARKLFPPFAALRAFEAIGRLGGVRRAAKELGLDHAVVSRHLRTLETWLGAPLVSRSDGVWQLTEAGQYYHQEIYAALSNIAKATDKVLRETSDLRLKIWCVPGFAYHWLSPRLSDFAAANPAIDIDLRPTDQGPDFKAKDVDGDIRYVRTWEEETMPKIVHRLEIARPLVFPVATPQCLAEMPALRTISDLFSAPLLHEDSQEEWKAWFRAQGIQPPPRLPGPKMWHAHVALSAARQSKGIALTNHLLASEDLAAGRLVAVQTQPASLKPTALGGYNFITREERWNSSAIVRFRQWLQQTIANEANAAARP